MVQMCRCVLGLGPFSSAFDTEVSIRNPKWLLLFLLFQHRHIFFSTVYTDVSLIGGSRNILGKLLFGSEDPLNKGSMYVLETKEISRLLWSINLKVLYHDSVIPTASNSKWLSAWRLRNSDEWGQWVRRSIHWCSQETRALKYVCISALGTGPLSAGNSDASRDDFNGKGLWPPNP